MGDKQLDSAPSASEPSSIRTGEVKPPAPTFVGNTNDLIAVIAATAAGISSICCISFGYGIYCLPVVGIILGAVAVINAQASMNPDRTRRWGWISVGVSGAIFLVIIAAIGLCIALYGTFVAAAIIGAQYDPTPTPRVH